MSATALIATRSLAEELLPRFGERAADHDATGVYAADDLAELQAADWFKAALPEDLGGLGLDLAKLGA